MADPYRESRRALKAVVLARVGAGESLAAVCRAAGMPSARAVNDWGRGDPLFRGELDLALARSAHRRRWAFDEARGRRFLARYRAGETIAEILRDPGMPSHRVLSYWRATDIGFAEAVVAAGRVAHAPRRRDAIRRAKTPWAFDEDVADAVLVAVMNGAEIRSLAKTHPGLPGRGVLARWRREQPQFAAELRAAVGHRRRRHGRAARNCAALTETVADRIAEGGSLHSLSQAPGMPDAATLYRWARRYPAFREALGHARADRADLYLDEIMALARAVTPANAAAVGRAIAALKRRVERLEQRPGWNGR